MAAFTKCLVALFTSGYVLRASLFVAAIAVTVLVDRRVGLTERIQRWLDHRLYD